MREIVLDTETTGLDPKSGDRIVEIGCIELTNHIPTGQEWHSYLNPERDVPKGAFDVHGLSGEFLSDKPLFEDIVDPFLEFIESSTLIIHNARFDIGFLNAELQRLKHPPLSMDRVIDSLALARRKHPGAQNNLDALCRRYKIDNSKREKHGALVDSEILAKVYVELIGGAQAKLGLTDKARKESQGHARMSPVNMRTKPLAKRLTAEEIRDHQAFIESLGSDALWRSYMQVGGKEG